MDVWAALDEAIQKQRDANVELKDWDRLVVERDGERYTGTISGVEDTKVHGIKTSTRMVFTLDTD
jgi:hypothetical protein